MCQGIDEQFLPYGMSATTMKNRTLMPDNVSEQLCNNRPFFFNSVYLMWGTTLFQLFATQLGFLKSYTSHYTATSFPVSLLPLFAPPLHNRLHYGRSDRFELLDRCSLVKLAFSVYGEDEMMKVGKTYAWLLRFSYSSNQILGKFH